MNKSREWRGHVVPEVRTTRYISGHEANETDRWQCDACDEAWSQDEVSWLDPFGDLAA